MKTKTVEFNDLCARPVVSLRWSMSVNHLSKSGYVIKMILLVWQCGLGLNSVTNKNDPWWWSVDTYRLLTLRGEGWLRFFTCTCDIRKRNHVCYITYARLQGAIQIYRYQFFEILRPPPSKISNDIKNPTLSRYLISIFTLTFYLILKF